MKENGKTSDIKTGEALSEIAASADSKPVAKKRARLIPTITARTMFNYCVFGAIILALLWIVFVSGLLWFYNALMRDDVRKVGIAASDAFPKRADDKSMLVLYRARLSEIARTNSIAAVVFDVADDGTVKIVMTVDAIGNSAIEGESNAVFESILSEINLRYVFSTRDGVGNIKTSYGSFVCYGSEHTVEHDHGCSTLGLLVLKPYDIFNYQTNKMLILLIICTVIVLILACVCAYFASRYQTKRLKSFTVNAQRLAAGDYDIKFDGYGYKEYEILAAALNDAKDTAVRSEKLQRDIIANVSHDIRTPLTIIRANAEMLRDMPLDEKKRKRTAEAVMSETDRLTVLVNDILNYSRLQAGVIDFEFAPCDISNVAKTVVKQFDALKKRDGISISANVEKGVIVDCDKQRIEQVFYNLISNACNYCGDDRAVIVKLYTVDGRARVEVTDHGKGIAHDELDSVWDRYYRTAHAQRTAVGSGLGLSICKTILTAHSARFGVQSELGNGSTFWFELDISMPAKNGGGAKL